MSTVEHKHPSEAAEEHPVGVGTHLHGYSGSQHHKDCREEWEMLKGKSFGSTGTQQKQHQTGGKPTRGEGITAVVKQLTQRRTAIGASGLLPIDGIQ